MALTVLPQARIPGVRRDFASELGGGLGEGLQLLAQQRIQGMLKAQEQRETASGLQALGFGEEASRQLSQLPSSSLNEVVKSKLAQPGKEAFAGALSNILGISDPSIEAEKQMTGLEEGAIDSEEQVPRAKAIPALNEKQALEIAKLQFEKEKIASKQRTEFRKESIAEQNKIDSETKDYFKEVTKQSKTAKENNKKLDRLEQLARKGSLGSPILNSLIKTATKGIFGIGIDVTNLMTADAQEFDKLSTDFVKGAKAIFGSRLTDADLKAFFKTVPTLMQSREGMMRVITNLRRSNDASVLRKKSMTEIIKENKGKRPSDIDSLVDERIDPVLDKWAADFLKSEPVQFSREGIPGKIFKALRLAY